MRKILLTGGGTGGATTPLLALAEVLKKREPATEFLFVGTPTGPEAELVASAGLSFQAIVAPKFRRYWDLQNIADLCRAPFTLWNAGRIIRRFRPSAVVSVGSFVSVPFALVGKIFNVPLFIHQQDIRKGLANRLMTPFADRITVTFQESLQQFPPDRTHWTGNPIRKSIFHGDGAAIRKQWKIATNEKILLVMGGGTGASALNAFVHHHLSRLTTEAVVIHLTGKGKHLGDRETSRYRPVAFIKEEMGGLLAAADLIISRAGIASITEGLTLGKAMVIVPMPQSHQEENVTVFQKRHCAIVIPQTQLHEPETMETIHRLLTNDSKRERLGNAASRLLPLHAAEHAADVLEDLLRSRYGH